MSLDTLRPDHMSAYGYRRRTTPFLETLAAESIVFEHAASQWPKTVPAFACLIPAVDIGCAGALDPSLRRGDLVLSSDDLPSDGEALSQFRTDF